LNVIIAVEANFRETLSSVNQLCFV